MEQLNSTRFHFSDYNMNIARACVPSQSFVSGWHAISRVKDCTFPDLHSDFAWHCERGRQIYEVLYHRSCRLKIVMAKITTSPVLRTRTKYAKKMF